MLFGASNPWWFQAEGNHNPCQQLAGNLHTFLSQINFPGFIFTSCVKFLFQFLWKGVSIITEELGISNRTTELQNSSFKFLAAILEHQDFHKYHLEKLSVDSDSIFKDQPFLNQYAKIYRLLTENLREHTAVSATLDIIVAFFKHREPNLYLMMIREWLTLREKVYAHILSWTVSQEYHVALKKHMHWIFPRRGFFWVCVRFW